jgi:hypothetical protein
MACVGDMTGKKPVFRERALEQLHSPERLDELMVLTSPRSWLALLSMAALILVALTWSVVGTVTRGVEGQGIILQKGGLKTAHSLDDGVVSELLVDVDDLIEVGQPIARVLDPAGGTRVESSPYRGRVVELMVNEGELIARGAALAAIVDEQAPLELLLYLAPTQGKQVEAGMLVAVSPTTVPREEYGYIHGRVASVSDYPKTKAGMLRHLQNERLVESLSQAGPPIEVWVELETGATTSGFAWSSGDGPPELITSGTLASARVTTRELRPISLLFPALGRDAD